jgi:alkylhydroperoxidase/carboxymuconolactone decarboxylase family protein YurZ
MVDQTVSQAWVALPSDEAVQARMPSDRPRPYDFGFIAGMSRLSRAHERIGRRFGALYAEIMFEPGALDRREKEMVAAVAAAAQDCHY